MNPNLLSAATILVCLLSGSSVRSAVIAMDTASDVAYAAEVGGAWKGLNPLDGENPPGTDNGGFGFQPWDFRGGYHNPSLSPYGALNHFIDGVDFSHRTANDLGTSAFGLTNAGSTPGDGFFGYTARGTRIFSALLPGQTLSLDFDNPLAQPLGVNTPSGFLFRLNKGGGPIINNAPLPGVVERFGMFVTSNFNGGRWYATDSASFTDTGLSPSTTASGTRFNFKLTGHEMYSAEFRRLSDNQLLFSRSGTLNHSGAGPIDSIEITLYNNGSSATGSREFFFNNLRIINASIPGDFDSDGDVDGADFVAWQTNFPKATGATLAQGDADGDGDVDGADFVAWQTNFPYTPAPGASPIPEPASISMLLACTLVMCVYRTCASRPIGFAVRRLRRSAHHALAKRTKSRAESVRVLEAIGEISAVNYRGARKRERATIADVVVNSFATTG
jgi:hypothetical protein